MLQKLHEIVFVFLRDNWIAPNERSGLSLLHFAIDKQQSLV